MFDYSEVINNAFLDIAKEYNITMRAIADALGISESKFQNMRHGLSAIRRNDLFLLAEKLKTKPWILQRYFTFREGHKYYTIDFPNYKITNVKERGYQLVIVPYCKNITHAMNITHHMYRKKYKDIWEIDN